MLVQGMLVRFALDQPIFDLGDLHALLPTGHPPHQDSDNDRLIA